MESALALADGASSFYTTASSGVNANTYFLSGNRIGETGFACDSPFPVLERDVWAEQLAGICCIQHKQPRSVAEVLGALLSHYRGKHTRCWPSVPTLAALSGWSERTVKRALAFAVAALGLQRLGGNDLADGPGPHLFTGARRGRHPVNCYEVGGVLARLFPRSPKQSPGSPGPADSTLPLTFEENPLDNWGRETVGFGCVGVSSENGDVEPEGKNEKRGEAHPPKVLSGNFGPHKNRGDRGSRDDSPAPPLSLPADGPGARLLRGLGVSGLMVRRIIEQRGDAWARTLARYAASQEGIENRAGYAVGVFKKWSEGSGFWPDELDAVAKREEIAAQRVVSAPVATVAPMSPEEIVTWRERGREKLDEILQFVRGKGKRNGDGMAHGETGGGGSGHHGTLGQGLGEAERERGKPEDGNRRE